MNRLLRSQFLEGANSIDDLDAQYAVPAANSRHFIQSDSSSESSLLRHVTRALTFQSYTGSSKRT